MNVPPPRYVSAFLLLGAFLFTYLPDVGHGFISDDFRWIHSARNMLRAPGSLLSDTTGFFRPVVTLSFAANSVVGGDAALGYGLTNLLLVIGCAVLVYGVCRAEALSPPAALAAAGVWSFNFHGINMAVLWISGRTSLLVTLFALLAAHATLRRRMWLAALWCLAALFSKEEALALPVMLMMWGGRAAWPTLLSIGIYLGARAATDAFWPSTAPDYYRFTFDIGPVAINAWHYLDRACTTSAVAAVIAMLASQRRFRWDAHLRRPVLHGLVWLAGGYAMTVWLPVRSSLYAVFPSVGAVLIFAALFDVLWSPLDSRARQRTAIVLLSLPLLLNPVYRSRNVRWVELADFTHAALTDIARLIPALRAGERLVVEDVSTSRANVWNAFGDHLPDAIEAQYGVRPEVEIVDGAAATGLSGDQHRPRFFSRPRVAP